MTPLDRKFLTRLFDSAIAAVDPVTALSPFLPARPKGRTIVIGAGKGAAQLASAFEILWDSPLEGVVVTRHGHDAECRHIKVLQAAHPVPDQAGLQASHALFQAVTDLTVDDLVVALICGGGSALLPAPPLGLTLEDEVALSSSLLASGAPISVMNLIRKHVSDIKGGRLALAAQPAQVVSLIVSDVPGDAPCEVASGPTVPSESTRADALAAIKSHQIELPIRITEYLASAHSEAPNPFDPAFERNEVHVIASAAKSLDAAAGHCKAAGLNAVILSDAIEGEAREVAKMHGAIAKEIRRRNRPFSVPVVLLSGGETTVTLQGNGKGGRNTEFLLSLAIELDGVDGIVALAADTDGIDGSEENAGAFVDGQSASRLRDFGHDPSEFLSNNDAWQAFSILGDLFSPGPTGTNVNDFRAILVR